MVNCVAMIDSPHDKTPDTPSSAGRAPNSPIEKRQAENAARAKESAAAFLDALKVHLKATRDDAWFRGWDKGFTEGWRAAAEHFAQAAEAKRSAHLPPAPPAQTEEGFQPLLSDVESVLEGSTAADKVLALIEANPGLRGVEIANRLSSIMLERTVRTALHRLRNTRVLNRKIRNVGGKWYTLLAAPADPQSSLIGDDDAAP